MFSQLRSVPQVEQAVLGNAHTRIVSGLATTTRAKLAMASRLRCAGLA